MRLAIITTHPIQYYSPVFQLLHSRKKLEIKVFYTWGELSLKKYDPGFNKKIEWDIPVLEGFPYEWAINTSRQPGSHHFKGIVTPGLISQIETWRPDALLIYGWGYKSHLKAMRHFKKKVPVYFRGDSTLLDEKKGIKNIMKSLFLKMVYRNVDHAFYVGKNSKDYFKKYGLKENQLSFAPHAVDNARFAADKTPEATVLRERFRIKDTDLLTIFAGKLEEKKAPIQLLDAFVSLKDASTHLLFVGNGPLEHELKQRAKGFPNVHFIGFQNQSQMPAVYQACDLFCLPSIGPGETWGLAINEAMACGKAILVSDKAGAAADLVKPGYNGAIFKAGSLTDLSVKLKRLLAPGKSELIKMGERSKEMIETFTFENQVNMIESRILNG